MRVDVGSDPYNSALTLNKTRRRIKMRPFRADDIRPYGVAADWIGFVGDDVHIVPQGNYIPPFVNQNV